MAVNLSPVGGVAAQFFTNTGAVLTGGKIYTYAAGTTTPAVTFTSSQGTTAWSNPIVLDAAGRVSGSGEIWLTDGINYKFVLKDSNDVLIATYDNISGINSNFVAYTNSQEIITATAGQTVFNLSISYQPGTNSLSVFVDGVNQYGPGAQYAYTETDSDTVTFVSGLHVGAQVKFTTSQQQGAGAVNASQVTYNPAGTGAVATNVQAKLRESVSVQDFGAVGDGITNDYAAFAAAIATGKSVLVPTGTYKIGSTLVFSGSAKQLVCDDAVVINYTGTANAITITGNNHNLQFGEVTANSGTEVVKYYNLSYSVIYFRAVGGCSNAVFLHDAASQTANAGNNAWQILRIEAGSVPYGIKIDSNSTYTLEGESWDVKVLFSATNTALRVGSSVANNKARYNEYNVSIDAQGITPLLIDVYNDFNFFNVRTWSGIEGNTHVRFNTGTGSNILTSQPGVESDLAVVDNGTNFYFVSGFAGQMIMGGRLSINLEAGGGSAAFEVGDNVSTGTDVISSENKSSANNTTKYVGFKWRGRDTVNSGKDVAYARAIPTSADWNSSYLTFYTRESNVLNPVLELRSDTSVAVYGNKILIKNSQTPASASATGEVGTIAWDSNYVYVCVATNTWKRTAISTW